MHLYVSHIVILKVKMARGTLGYWVLFNLDSFLSTDFVLFPASLYVSIKICIAPLPTQIVCSVHSRQEILCSIVRARKLKRA